MTASARARRGEELREIAATLDAPFLRAMAAHSAARSISLARATPTRALTALRRRAGYVARDRGAVRGGANASADRARLPRCSARRTRRTLELDAARPSFSAARGCDRRSRGSMSSRVAMRRRADAADGRELEVLALVATGKTNRAIADALGLSEKTVARHVEQHLHKARPVVARGGDGVRVPEQLV